MILKKINKVIFGVILIIYIFMPIVYEALREDFFNFLPCFFSNVLMSLFYWILVGLIIIFGITNMMIGLKKYKEHDKIIFRQDLDVDSNICPLCFKEPKNNMDKDIPKSDFIDVRIIPENLVPKEIPKDGKFHITCLEYLPRKTKILHPIFLFLFELFLPPIIAIYINLGCATKLYTYSLFGFVIDGLILYTFYLAGVLSSKSKKLEWWLTSYRLKHGPKYNNFREQVENIPYYWTILAHSMAIAFFVNIGLSFLFYHFGPKVNNMISLVFDMTAICSLFIIPIIMRFILNHEYKKKYLKI